MRREEIPLRLRMAPSCRPVACCRAARLCSDPVNASGFVLGAVSRFCPVQCLRGPCRARIKSGRATCRGFCELVLTFFLSPFHSHRCFFLSVRGENTLMPFASNWRRWQSDSYLVEGHYNGTIGQSGLPRFEMFLSGMPFLRFLSYFLTRRINASKTLSECSALTYS